MESNSKFEEKWKKLYGGKSSEELTLFVPKGKSPTTQRQFDLYWYYKFFERLIENKGYKNGLELGCGRGTLSLYLNQYEGLDVNLIDVSKDAINLAKINFNLFEAKGNFCLASCDNLPFPDSHFDIVYSIGLLEHLPDYKKTIIESYRVLKPGGIMVSLNFPSKKSVQSINDIYKKILKLATSQDCSLKDYYRNSDGPGQYLSVARDAGFKDVFTVNVAPFPIFVPISMQTDKIIVNLYKLIVKFRLLFLNYPFKTNYLLSRGHFLVGYKY